MRNEQTQMDEAVNNETAAESVAIIGMAGRFPGARNVREFWENLRNGIDSIHELTDEELRTAGVSDELISNPAYVRRIGLCKDSDMFDAEFFGIHAREAEVIDPQHRILLECAWEAFEDAGYAPGQASGLTGVYVGCGMNKYLVNYIAGNQEIENTVGDYQIMIGNAPDYLATRISYKLDLRGPSVSVYTACSTSLVAVHTACQSLLTYQCDMALAGGCTLKFPHHTGFLFKDGHILSPDGYCRAFDEKSSGTAWGEGAGIVLLKRLSEAIQDGDSIYAVIKSTAINNDGSGKVGFTAPSIEGQARAITLAHMLAEIEPESVSYVETHGTGTPLGDPIEIAGLTRAFAQNGEIAGKTCAIGSVKTNIGHLDAAAGVTGLIKTALALKHKMLPPSLHFTAANPKLGLEKTPFYVNATLQPWNTAALPRRAGVSSFGIGGTNAHAVLEEAPDAPEEGSSTQQHVFLLSARSPDALETATGNFCTFLKESDPLAIADIAYTLQTGRKHFPYRCALVGSSVNTFVDRLDPLDSRFAAIGNTGNTSQNIVFMFSGQGTQYPRMAAQLYKSYKVFSDLVDYCAEKFKPLLNIDLRNILFPAESGTESAADALSQTQFTQPALFTIEYSLARLIMSWGVQPTALIGHSIGEYVAACLSGVFTFDDTLSLIANRARLMQEQPAGAMLSISAAREIFQPFLTDETEIALVNGPGIFVVGGPLTAIDILAEKLDKNKIVYRRLHTSHAFHTAMMENVCKPLEEIIAAIPKASPQIPFISNVSGTWVTPAQAISPQYWTSHLRSTVHFSEGIDELLHSMPDSIYIEIGPGNSLCTLTGHHATPEQPVRVIQTLPHAKQHQSDVELFLLTLGTLWTYGFAIDWQQSYKNELRKRVHLTTYPFERQRYFIEPENKSETVKQHKVIPSTPVVNNEKQSKRFHPRPRLTTELADPVSTTEKNLAQVWQQFLGISPIGINDNFFELGGHSLIAVNLFAEIHRKTGANLPLAVLFAAPTIKELAEKVDAASPVPNESNSDDRKNGVTFHTDSNWNYVVPIKPTGKRSPFFFMHGVGGNVLNYKILLPYMDNDQPFYGVQCRGLDGIQKPFESIEIMARHYVQEIRQLQPHGPYLLGGGSMGGLIAFEMAQQFNVIGEPVGLVLMIDSTCPYVVKKLIRQNTFKQNTIEVQVKPSQKRPLIKKIIHSITCRVEDAKKIATCEYYRKLGKPIPHELRYWLIEQKNIAITEAYVPKPYNGMVTMFRATKNFDNPDPYRGWKDDAVGGMTFYDFEYNHYDIIEKSDVGRKIGDVLKSVVNDSLK